VVSSVTIDWPRIFQDLADRGVHMTEISRRTGIPRTTLNRYLDASQPSHAHGEEIIGEWIATTGRSRTNLPVTGNSVSELTHSRSQ
jgi:lambda repressor-like predicted transcriptional regulator